MSNLIKQAVVPLPEAYLNFLKRSDPRLHDFMLAEIRWSRHQAVHPEGSLRWRVEDRGYGTPCWVWQGRCLPNGYSMRTKNNRSIYGHIYNYQKFNNVVLSGRDPQLDHLCRVRACVNPTHLELIPQLEHILRGTRVRLSLEKAREIRRLAALGWSQRAIGRKFGVNGGHICHVLQGKVWAE